MTSGQTPLSSDASEKSAANYRREPRERVFALQIVAAQVIFTGVLSLLGWLFSRQEINHQVAIAILCGGIISSLTNLWLAMVVFRPALGAPVGKMLSAFYVGGIGKFVITALLFLLAFQKFALLKDPAHALLMLLGYVFTQAVVWIYPLFKK